MSTPCFTTLRCLCILLTDVFIEFWEFTDTKHPFPLRSDDWSNRYFSYRWAKKKAYSSMKTKRTSPTTMVAKTSQSMYSRCFKVNRYHALHLIQLAKCKQSFEVELLRPVSKSRRRKRKLVSSSKKREIMEFYFAVAFLLPSAIIKWVNWQVIKICDQWRRWVLHLSPRTDQ